MSKNNQVFYDKPKTEALKNPESAFSIMNDRNLVQMKIQKPQNEASVNAGNNDFQFWMINDYLYFLTGITPMQVRIKIKELWFKLYLSQQGALDILSLS